MMFAKLRSLLPGFLLFLAVTASVYGASVYGNFYVEWDDYTLIVNNPILQRMSWKNVGLAFSTYDPELYIPLTLLSYHADRIIGSGFVPQITHAVNLLLHTLNAFLIALLLGILTRDRKAGFLAGLLFAVHPLNTEAVAWASARKDLLATFFFLIAWISYLRASETKNQDTDKRWYALSLSAFVLALLSKVIAITLPVAILLTAYLRKRQPTIRGMQRLFPFFCLSVSFGFIAMFGQHGSSSWLYEKILIGCVATFHYLRQLVLPYGFSILYPFTGALSLRTHVIALSVFGIVAITIVLACFVRQKRELVFAWFFYLLTLAPTMTNFTKSNYYEQDVYVGSDRYAYIASIGFFLLIALLLRNLLRSYAKISYALVVLLTVGLGTLAYLQATVWRDSGVLFANVLLHHPNSHLARNNVGVILLHRGYTKLAIEQFNESLKIRPNERAYYNLGYIYEDTGDSTKARMMYLQALEQNPGFVDAMVGIGILDAKQQDFTAAEGRFADALAIEPRHGEASWQMGLLHEQRGETEQALEWYRKAEELLPDQEKITEKIRELTGG